MTPFKEVLAARCGEWNQQCVLSCFSHFWFFVTLWTAVHQAPLSRDAPGKNIGVGCHALLQEIFLTQDQTHVSMSPALAGGFFITSITLGSLRISRQQPNIYFWGPNSAAESCLAEVTLFQWEWDGVHNLRQIQLFQANTRPFARHRSVRMAMIFLGTLFRLYLPNPACSHFSP